MTDGSITVRVEKIPMELIGQARNGSGLHTASVAMLVRAGLASLAGLPVRESVEKWQQEDGRRTRRACIETDNSQSKLDN